MSFLPNNRFDANRITPSQPQANQTRDVGVSSASTTIEQIEQERRQKIGHPDLQRERYRYYQEDRKKPTTIARQILRGTHEDSLLNQLYFSQKNIDMIQNAIRYKVYELSNGQFVIGRQDDNELIITMRGIFLSRGRNLPCSIKDQIKCLNNLVINEITPKIISQVHQYNRYIYDASHLYAENPVPHPINVSSKGTKINRSVTDLF